MSELKIDGGFYFYAAWYLVVLSILALLSCVKKKVDESYRPKKKIKPKSKPKSVVLQRKKTARSVQEGSPATESFISSKLLVIKKKTKPAITKEAKKKKSGKDQPKSFVYDNGMQEWSPPPTPPLQLPSAEKTPDRKKSIEDVFRVPKKKEEKAPTRDPQYQTLAGLTSDDVFGPARGAANRPLIKPPKVIEPIDPYNATKKRNYETLAGLMNDEQFEQKNDAGVKKVQIKAPGKVVAKDLKDPKYQTLAGLTSSRDVFIREGAVCEDEVAQDKIKSARQDRNKQSFEDNSIVKRGFGSAEKNKPAIEAACDDKK